ncbi:hypothetical protein C4E21_05555 [Bacillus subtilis]|nr:hypothetical protein C4E21_05555 [Bacillus subtilis]
MSFVHPSLKDLLRTKAFRVYFPSFLKKMQDSRKRNRGHLGKQHQIKKFVLCLAIQVLHSIPNMVLNFPNKQQ